MIVYLCVLCDDQGGDIDVDVSKLFSPSVLNVTSMQSTTLSMVTRVGDVGAASVVTLAPLNITSFYVTL